MTGYAGWRDWIPPTAATSTVVKRRSKYGAEKTVVDNITFDSKREADRYSELKLMAAAGEITDLHLQPQYPLHATSPTGVRQVIGRYIADFKFTRDGQTVIEDAKGFRGKELYVWKRRHVEIEYAIKVTEV